MRISHIYFAAAVVAWVNMLAQFFMGADLTSMIGWLAAIVGFIGALHAQRQIER